MAPRDGGLDLWEAVLSRASTGGVTEDVLSLLRSASVQSCTAAGIAVVGDIERVAPTPTPDERVKLAEVLPLVDHLVVPRHFAQEWTGLYDVGQAAGQLWEEGVSGGFNRSAVVVTCGSAGCWYIDGDIAGRGAVHCPAFVVEVTDTTGCGDVFHGAYCVALVEGMGLAERVRFASSAAALKATRRGGQAGIPMRKQLNAFLVERE